MFDCQSSPVSCCRWPLPSSWGGHQETMVFGREFPHSVGTIKNWDVYPLVNVYITNWTIIF